MTEQATWLDGNGVAGLMREVFGTEMSTALRVCAGCGAAQPARGVPRLPAAPASSCAARAAASSRWPSPRCRTATWCP